MKNFKYFTLVPNASSQHLQHRRVLRGLSGGGGGARHRCAPLPVGNAHVGAAGNEELDEVKVAAFDRCEERRRGARSARGVLRFYSKITFSKHLGSLGCSEFLLYEFPFLYLVTQFSTRRLPNRERSHVVRGVAEVLGESRLKSARPGGVDA